MEIKKQKMKMEKILKNKWEVKILFGFFLLINALNISVAILEPNKVLSMYYGILAIQINTFVICIILLLNFIFDKIKIEIPTEEKEKNRKILSDYVNVKSSK